MAVPAYGPPFGAGPPGPGRAHRGLIIAVVTLGVLLLLACTGLVGGAFLLRAGADDPAEPVPATWPSTTAGSPPAPDPTGSAEPAPQGPQASDFAAAEITDLNNVCDGVLYYPQSPKRAGKAPHPVALLIGDTPGGQRRQDNGYYYDEGLSKQVERIWAAEDPKTVQMVACLDRVSTGATIRKCRYDDPKPDTLTLLKATYRLRVHEVATGRRLLDKTLGGDDQACPYVVLVGADKKIYAEVSDRSLLAALRNLVKR
ncbi:hypothetical protein ACN27B_19335 [Micromonospora sp. WMMD754]|uniref:hypothetical protein n=1 Tax=Micromonospora sp. WMMD754 TaxID=3404114 RepID=UPI003BF597D3